MGFSGKRPSGRRINPTGLGKGIFRRGEGLGGAPVGIGNARQNSAGTSGSGSRMTRGGGGFSIIGIILAAVVLLGGGGFGLSSLFGGSGNGNGGNILSSINLAGSAASTGWDLQNNTGSLNHTIDTAARSKYTTVQGDGSDTVTVMVYLCGTDLESKGGMATSDLNEMKAATKVDGNLRLIVYTGGCKSWKTPGVSNTSNGIFEIRRGNLTALVPDDGNKRMTDPATLSGFIRYCAEHYPANRNMLIFWDHGGGSLSGYGYDERFPSDGSMGLKGIDTALRNGGVRFDLIGFDACLMATAENALMLSQYADYMIASEETEPGIGWYYTNWLNALGGNTGLPTLEIGKMIADDFVEKCAVSCRGQKTTLSVVDLAELENTLPADLTGFAKSASALLSGDDYAKVSDARAGSREFAASSKIDQVDLIHLANNVGTTEAKALVNTLLSAVKYNRTSSDLTNAYGLSIYFPYKKTSAVDSAVATYDSIGMDDAYSDCIRKFAGMEVSGQIAAGGNSSPLPSLLGQLGGSSGTPSAGSIAGMLGSFLGSGSGISGLNLGNIGFLSSSDQDRAAGYIAQNMLDPSALRWKNGLLTLSEEQWGLVQNLELNVFYDDGEGYIDMGLDNVYAFDDDGNLLGRYGSTWVAINRQPCAYYYTDMTESGGKSVIHGYVPILLNGEGARLLISFTEEGGFVSGVCYTASEGEAGTVGKEYDLTVLKPGDKIDFTADYYSYGGQYLDSYRIGEQRIYDGTLTVEDVEIDERRVSACYRVTDIYHEHYWTEVMN